MAIINKIDNTASIVYNGTNITSLPATTLLLLLPTITKTVDLAVANVGDTLKYTMVITNIGLTTITNIPLTDVIPNGCTYVTNSFTVNGTSATPTFTANQLNYTVPSIAALGVVTITFQVHIVGGEA